MDSPLGSHPDGALVTATVFCPVDASRLKQLSPPPSATLPTLPLLVCPRLSGTDANPDSPGYTVTSSIGGLIANRLPQNQSLSAHNSSNNGCSSYTSLTSAPLVGEPHLSTRRLLVASRSSSDSIGLPCSSGSAIPTIVATLSDSSSPGTRVPSSIDLGEKFAVAVTSSASALSSASASNHSQTTSACGDVETIGVLAEQKNNNFVASIQPSSIDGQASKSVGVVSLCLQHDQRHHQSHRLHSDDLISPTHHHPLHLHHYHPIKRHLYLDSTTAAAATSTTTAATASSTSTR
ncbi:unnamed protein product [Protopolystoma xenopodis]|uniref:Uncharacterized protein n=1 Tax=Protopolystoma xenopodis TaxID=117903 RepID=A0A3S5A8R8_9PLAT|nr:unnamed protein product [Protopolystoma xenopodis]